MEGYFSVAACHPVNPGVSCSVFLWWMEHNAALSVALHNIEELAPESICMYCFFHRENLREWGETVEQNNVLSNVIDIHTDANFLSLPGNK